MLDSADWRQADCVRERAAEGTTSWWRAGVPCEGKRGGERRGRQERRGRAWIEEEEAGIRQKGKEGKGNTVVKN